MKLAVHKNHLGGQILYRSLDLSKKRRLRGQQSSIFTVLYPTSRHPSSARRWACSRNNVSPIQVSGNVLQSVLHRNLSHASHPKKIFVNFLKYFFFNFISARKMSKFVTLKSRSLRKYFFWTKKNILLVSPAGWM